MICTIAPSRPTPSGRAVSFGISTRKVQARYFGESFSSLLKGLKATFWCYGILRILVIQKKLDVNLLFLFDILIPWDWRDYAGNQQCSNLENILSNFLLERVGYYRGKDNLAKAVIATALISWPWTNSAKTMSTMSSAKMILNHSTTDFSAEKLTLLKIGIIHHNGESVQNKFKRKVFHHSSFIIGK